MQKSGQHKTDREEEPGLGRNSTVLLPEAFVLAIVCYTIVFTWRILHCIVSESLELPGSDLGMSSVCSQKPSGGACSYHPALLKDTSYISHPDPGQGPKWRNCSVWPQI